MDLQLLSEVIRYTPIGNQNSRCRSSGFPRVHAADADFGLGLGPEMDFDRPQEGGKGGAILTDENSWFSSFWIFLET